MIVLLVFCPVVDPLMVILSPSNQSSKAPGVSHQIYLESGIASINSVAGSNTIETPPSSGVADVALT